MILQRYVLQFAVVCIWVVAAHSLQGEFHQFYKICYYASFVLRVSLTNTKDPHHEFHPRDSSLATNSSTHQNPALAPPIPIELLSSQYIEATLKYLAGQHNGTLYGNSSSNWNSTSKLRRQLSDPTGAELCGVGNPCPDGSCCGSMGM